MNTFLAQVVEFKLPDGKQVIQNILLPRELEEKYIDMVRSGCRFEAELLTTGLCSITISNEDDDVDIRVFVNGTDNLLIDNFSNMLMGENWK